MGFKYSQEPFEYPGALEQFFNILSTCKTEGSSVSENMTEHSGHDSQNYFFGYNWKGIDKNQKKKVIDLPILVGILNNASIDPYKIKVEALQAKIRKRFEALHPEREESDDEY